MNFRYFVLISLVFLLSMGFVSAITNATDGFSIRFLHAGGTPSILGMDTNGTDIWMTEEHNGFIYRLDHEGNNLSGGFKSVMGGYPTGVTVNATGFWVVGVSSNATHYLANGTLSSTYNLGGWSIESNASDFWVSSPGSCIIHRFNFTFHEVDNVSLCSSGLGSPEDIAHNGSDFWLTDGGDDFVYHFNSSWDNQTDGFSTGEHGATNPTGIVTNSTDFWVVDQADDFVYHFYDDSGITLNVPVNNYTYYNGENVTFNITAKFLTGLNNMSFLVNNVVIETSDLDGTTNTSLFYRVFNYDGNVNWSVIVGLDDGTLEYTNNRTLKNTAQYSFTGGLLPTCDVENGSLTTSYLYTSGSTATDTITCTLGGYSDYVNTYDVSDGDKTFTLAHNRLFLGFFYYNGSAYDTTGYWSDENRTVSFSGENLTINMSSTVEGITRVQFGYNVSAMNYTQFYEFDNNWAVNSTENMTIISTNTNAVYFKVRDTQGNPINDALIRIAVSIPTGAYREMGQRFTGSVGYSGITMFNIPDNSDISIRVTANGYSAWDTTDYINDAIYTSSNPYVIDLQSSGLTVYKGVSITVYQQYDNETSTMPLFIYAPSREEVEFTTSCISENYSIDLDQFKTGSSTLTKGTHYCVDSCSSCTDDFTITIYIDGNEHQTLTVEYIGRDDTRFTTPTELSSDILRKVAWVFLIFLVGILGLVIKGTEEGIGMGARGKIMFLIGCGILPIVFLGQFIFLMVVVIPSSIPILCVFLAIY